MASNSFFVSVMTPPTSAGVITLNINTYPFSTTSNNHPDLSGSGIPEGLNTPSNAYFTLDITVAGTEKEAELATLISTTLGTYLINNNLNYQGWLAFAEEPYLATFQVTKTDHCVCVWTQATYTMEVTANDTGAAVEVHKSPILLTLEEAKEIAVLIGWDFKTFNGATLNNTQIIAMLHAESAYLTSRLRNNLVISTYAKEYRGNDTDTVSMGPRPLIDFDQPRIRRKNISDTFNLPQWGKFAFFINHEKGTLKFRFSETIVDNREPFSIQNLIYISFIAGHNTIPETIKTAVVEFGRFRASNRNGIKSMKGGSGMFEFESSKEILYRISNPIKPYKMRT